MYVKHLAQYLGHIRYFLDGSCMVADNFFYYF